MKQRRTIIPSMYTDIYLTVTRIVCIVCVPSKMCFIKGILLMIIVYYLVIFKAQYKKSVFNAPPLIYSFSGS